MVRHGALEACLLTALIAGCGDTAGDPNDPPPGDVRDCASLEPFPNPIEGDVTLQRGCYLAERDVVVGGGHLLTLEPGVLIRFGPGVALNVFGGKLRAEGTEDLPIVLAGEQATRGYWEGVRFRASDFTENALARVFIEDAGGSGAADAAALYLDDDQGPVRLTATETTIKGSAGFGLYTESNQARHNLEWRLGTVTDNAGAAFVPAQNLRALAGDSTWAGNDDGFVVTGGPVADSDTWRALDVPYRVDEDIEIQEGTITVSPGATFELGAGIAVRVRPDGALTAAGTEAAPVTFTGVQPTRGFHAGLVYYSTNSVDNVLDHVVVEHGGAGDTEANVYLDDDDGPVRLAVTSSTLRQSSGWGLYAEDNQNAHAIDAFEDNRVTENARAVHLASEDAGELSASSSFTGNDEDFVELVRPTTSDQTWAALDAPYRIPERITIEEGAAVLIAAGATVELGRDSGITVRGALAAEGTASAPVTFTGVQKTAGHWDGVTYASTDSVDNRLVYAVFEYGGGAPDRDGGLVYLDDDDGGSRLAVEDTTFRESANWGIYVEMNQFAPTLSCSNPTFDVATLAEGAVGNDADGALPGLCD